MRFSLFHLPTYREGFSTSLNAFYGELADAVKLADRLGWAHIDVSEHHFHYYGGAVPNPAIILAAWARETKKIRLAAGVSLVPLRHPLQVAEDYALVDQLSGGRLDMGVSRGFVPHEFEGFGVAPTETNERVVEALGILEKFWSRSRSLTRESSPGSTGSRHGRSRCSRAFRSGSRHPMIRRASSALVNAVTDFS